MDNCKVNILGTEYNVEFNHENKESDGEAFFYEKRIEIKPIQGMLNADSTIAEKEKRQKEVFRHELLHCTLFESGNSDYAYDEKLIEALSILTPKIFKVFQELDLL